MATEIKYKHTHLAGDLIGTLIFLHRVESEPGRPKAKFRCACGNEFITRIEAAKSGKAKSCGCMRMQTISQPKNNYVKGDKIGELTFLNRAESQGAKGHAHPMANFLCECGKEFVCRIDTAKNRVAKSCGCKKAELNRAASTKHGHAGNGKRSLEYNTWEAMWSRVTLPSQQNYERYQQLGVSICLEWQDFNVFLKDMGPRPSKEHTIERIDNTDGYFKENCRWATKKEQSRNMRNTTFVEYMGHRKSLPEWAEVLGLTLATLHGRIVASGWPAERAFTTPSRDGKFPNKVIKTSNDV